MLSALIPTANSQDDLALLLAALVPAAVEGLVREVICADAGSTDATAALCEDAGAKLIQGGLAAAAQAARSDWLLILPVDLRLAGGWDDAVAQRLAQRPEPLKVSGLKPHGLIAGLAPAPCGLVVQKARVVSRAETRDAKALITALGRGAARL